MTITEWAGSVAIAIDLPDSVTDRAVAYYRTINPIATTVNQRGVVAYVRHHYSNYPSILSALRTFGDGRRHAYQIVKQRTNAMIVQALSERGVRCE